MARPSSFVDVERESRDGKLVLYIPCPVCRNRLFMVDGYPLSGAEAEQELRMGFMAHVADHKARGETRESLAKVRHR